VDCGLTKLSTARIVSLFIDHFQLGIWFRTIACAKLWVDALATNRRNDLLCRPDAIGGRWPLDLLIISDVLLSIPRFEAIQ
jgi:hypothetical protein